MRRVRRLTFGGGDGHQRRLRRDVCLNDRFGLRHRIGVAETVDRIGLDQVLLVRRRRVDTLVNCRHGARRDARAEEMVKAHVAAHADIMAVPAAERQAAHARF